MRRTTANKLKNANPVMLSIVRNYLNKYGIRVRKWMPYRGKRTSRDVVYEAFYDDHSVNIPVPVDRYSFYVCMHEIGHLVKGDRIYGYTQEYVAEQYAIAKLIKYGYYTKEIEESARRYVYEHLIQDLVIRNLNPSKVSTKVIEWTGRTKEQARKRALRLAKLLHKHSDNVPNALQRLSTQPLSAKVYKSILELSINQLR